MTDLGATSDRVAEVLAHADAARGFMPTDEGRALYRHAATVSADGVGIGQHLGNAVGGGPRVSHRQDTRVVSDTVRVRESRLTGRTGPPR